MPLPRKTEHKMLNEFVPKVTLLRPLDPEGKTSMKLKTVQMLFEMIEIQKKMYVYTQGRHSNQCHRAMALVAFLPRPESQYISQYIKCIFSSNQIVHKISFSHCFWAPDSLINNFY